jgi:hypothetical protein
LGQKSPLFSTAQNWGKKKKGKKKNTEKRTREE